MLFFLSTLAIVLPSVLCHNCNMPSQMFGTAVYTPTSLETKSHYIAVDFEDQKAVVWPLLRYYGLPSEEAKITKDFQYFDFEARKVYTKDGKGNCRVDTIDKEITFPMVNPATDDVSFKGSWDNVYKKGDVSLSAFNKTCRPYTGSLLQIKVGEPITMSYSFYETPIEKYSVLERDITDC